MDYPVATIRFEARYDGTKVTHVRMTWEGDYNTTAATFDLLKDMDPRFSECHNVLNLGDMIRIGQFQLKVIAIDLKLEYVYLERVGEVPLENMDAEGWIKG